MSKRNKILYIVEDTDSAQFRYRVKNVIESMEGSKRWEGKWIPKTELSEKELDGVLLVVVLRQTAKDNAVPNFIRMARKRGIKVLFDLDDLVFSYKYLPILMSSTNSKNIFYWTGYVWGIRRIAKRVDGFIATNEFLGKKLKRTFKKPFAVIPNSLNATQVKIADEALVGKKHDGFVVGYFSGSPTHAKDFAVAEPEVIRFLEEHNDATLNVVGYMRFSKKAEKLVDKKKIKFLPMVDFRKLQRLMAEVDVNIAPLLINDFTNCKSELKFFEAAAVETTTIASPTYVFSRAITDGENGFLAEPGEWYDKLEYLYKNPSENIKIAKAARKYALENYYGKKFLKEVEETYDSFMV